MQMLSTAAARRVALRTRLSRRSIPMKFFSGSCSASILRKEPSPQPRSTWTGPGRRKSLSIWRGAVSGSDVIPITRYYGLPLSPSKTCCRIHAVSQGLLRTEYNRQRITALRSKISNMKIKLRRSGPAPDFPSRGRADARAVHVATDGRFCGRLFLVHSARIR